VVIASGTWTPDTAAGATPSGLAGQSLPQGVVVVVVDDLVEAQPQPVLGSRPATIASGWSRCSLVRACTYASRASHAGQQAPGGRGGGRPG
jgi:hypothetical protein